MTHKVLQNLENFTANHTEQTIHKIMQTKNAIESAS